MSFLGWFNNKELQDQIDSLTKELVAEKYAHKLDVIARDKTKATLVENKETLRHAGDQVAELLGRPGKKASKAVIEEAVANWESAKRI